MARLLLSQTNSGDDDVSGQVITPTDSDSNDGETALT